MHTSPSATGKFDVAVIGAGVFGAWIARQCHQKVKSVVLVDCRGPANALASSGGESRILRIGYGPKKFYSEWALVSLAKWQAVLDRIGPELLVRCGVLWIGSDTDTYLMATIAHLRELKVRIESLDASQLRRRFPQIAPEPGSIGILECDSGLVLARRAVQALVADLISRGVVYRQARILAPNLDGRLSEVVASDGERIQAAQYVFACGPWLARLFPDIVGASIMPTRQEVFFFAAPPGSTEFAPANFPVWLDFRHGRIFYGMPDMESRGLKIASDEHGEPIDPDLEERLVTEGALAKVRNFLRTRFPRLAAAPLVETRVCQYENSPTGDFIIDRHPRAENVWIVGAGSGHGFKHGPAVGFHVSDLLDGAPLLERFSISRARRLREAGRAVH